MISIFFRIVIMVSNIINPSPRTRLNLQLVKVDYFRKKAALNAEEIMYREAKSRTVRGKLCNWLISWTGFNDFCNRRLYSATLKYCKQSVQAGVLSLLIVQNIPVLDIFTLEDLIEQYKSDLPKGLTERIQQSDFVKAIPTIVLTPETTLKSYWLSEECHGVIAMQLELIGISFD